MSCCGNQWEGPKKIFGGDECFSCLGNSQALMLEPEHVYKSCSPLVEGETKNAPLKPMTAKEECIVAWVGPCCDINASEWTEACKQHVYPHAVVYKDRASWPCDEEGNSIFTVEDIDFIAQGHTCCTSFDEIQSCQEAREWLTDIESNNQGKVA